jgi:hypothetical protein
VSSVDNMGEMRNAYKIWVEKPEGKRPPERPRRRCEDNIIIDLTETGSGGKNWVNLTQDRDQWLAVKTRKLIFDFHKTLRNS